MLLSQDLKIIVTPSTGSTHIDNEYCKQNNIDFLNLLNLFEQTENRIRDIKNKRENGGMDTYKSMKEFIEKEYSWDKVAELMFDYFKYIVASN